MFFLHSEWPCRPVATAPPAAALLLPGAVLRGHPLEAALPLPEAAPPLLEAAPPQFRSTCLPSSLEATSWRAR